MVHAKMLPHSYPHHWKTSTSRCILESKKPLNLPAWFEKKSTQSTAHSLPIDQQYKFDLGIIQSNCLFKTTGINGTWFYLTVILRTFCDKKQRNCQLKMNKWYHVKAICQNKFDYMMNRKALKKEPHYSPTKLFREAKANTLNP